MSKFLCSSPFCLLAIPCSVLLVVDWTPNNLKVVIVLSSWRHPCKLHHLKCLNLRSIRITDRHGPLKDEASSIHWLLSNRNAHMRALADDLAKSKRLYEPPLVRADGTTHVVFDGNRRICCLKLLLDPKLAPSKSWSEFFSALGVLPEVTEAFSRIECEIETDLATIDELLYRRHTGSQDGVGQSQIGIRKVSRSFCKELAELVQVWGKQ